MFTHRHSDSHRNWCTYLEECRNWYTEKSCHHFKTSDVWRWLSRLVTDRKETGSLESADPRCNGRTEACNNSGAGHELQGPVALREGFIKQNLSIVGQLQLVTFVKRLQERNELGEYWLINKK